MASRARAQTTQGTSGVGAVEEPENSSCARRCNAPAYYVAHSWREVRKRKFNFCLGSCSVFLVVMVAAVTYTLIAKAPVIFLQQAETKGGQFDLRMYLEEDASARYINYTQLAESTSGRSRLDFHSPRHVAQVDAFDVDCTNFTADALGLDPFESVWKYEGVDPETSSCDNYTAECVTSLCGEASRISASVVGIDTERESRMGLGRTWSEKYDPLGPGEALLSTGIARDLGAQVGDVVYVSVRTGGADDPLMLELTSEAIRINPNNIATTGDRNDTMLLGAVAREFPLTVVPLTVVDIFSRSRGKLPRDDEKKVMIVELKHWLPLLAQHLHPALRRRDVAGLRALGDKDDQIQPFPSRPDLRLKDLNHSAESVPWSVADAVDYALQQGAPFGVGPDAYATEVLMSLPPSERVDAYLSTDYDEIQRTVILFASSALYYAGFPEVDIELEVLEEVRAVRFFALFLGLIMSIILTILFILSTMLIYSLLMISVEIRTFELGVHRMVGMTSAGVVKLLSVQACSYSVPAWVIGLVLSQLLCGYMLAGLEESAELTISKRLTTLSVIVATVLGLVIPLVAAVFPIRQALRKNLHDALDTRHSKTHAVQISIERSEDKGVSAEWMVVGAGLAAFGFLIYYLLPLSLLSFNLALFFNIFFGLLLGMLIGLILLSLNLEHAIERFVVFVCLWWEKRVLTHIVLKNLVAHRVRNRKTTIMYALSLGFILFISVAYNMELRTAESRTVKGAGAKMAVYTGNRRTTIPAEGVREYEAVLAASPAVEQWAWATQEFEEANTFVDTYITNVGHAYERELNVYGVSPNFFDVAEDEFLVTAKEVKGTGLSLSEQLYTVRGGQSALVGSAHAADLALGGLGSDSSFLVALQDDATDTSPASLLLWEMKPMAQVDSSPSLRLTRFPSQTRAQDFAVSLPTYVRLSGGKYDSVEDVPMSTAILQFKNGASDAQKDELVEALAPINDRYGMDLFDRRDLTQDLRDTDAVMNIIFGSVTYIAMFLCLFSLMASMYTNIYEQSKEIAILRALGLRRGQITRVYVYEAFTLTLAASLMGIVIGFIMAWTMTLQRVIFTQLPMTFAFPYTIVGFVVLGAAMCAFIAAFFPARILVSKTVSRVMRTVI